MSENAGTATLIRPQAPRWSDFRYAGFGGPDPELRPAAPVSGPRPGPAARPPSRALRHPRASRAPRAPQAPRASRAPQSHLRLTRRGRAFLLLTAVMLLLVAISLGRTGTQAATSAQTRPVLQQTTVQPGETLWSLAERIAPANDPREVLAEIQRINHLQSVALIAGQQLFLPAGR